MTNDIRARLSGTQAIGRVPPGGGRTDTGAALVALSGRVAEQMAGSLDLSGRDAGHDRRGGNFVLPGDLYEVNRQADELARQIGAGPADAARLAQALHRFAEACATLIAARPAAFSLEQVRSVVNEAASGSGGPENVAAACAAIDRAVRALESGQW